MSYLNYGFNQWLTRDPIESLSDQRSPSYATGALGIDGSGEERVPFLIPVSSEHPNTFNMVSFTPHQIEAGIPPGSFTLDKLNINNLGIGDYIQSIGFETGVSGWRIEGNGDAEFNEGTFRGTLTAPDGAIGGWTIGASDLSGGDAVLHSSGYLKLGADNNVVRIDATDVLYRLWVGNASGSVAPFRVEKDGSLVATDATITGSVTATTGAIGGFTIGADYIRDTAGVVGMSSAVTGGDDIRFWAGDATPASAEFRVTESGALTASNATISGTVTASSGTIGGWSISANEIKAGSGATTVALDSGVSGADDVRIYAGNATPSSAPFRVTESGVLTALSGTIGGTTVDSTSLTGGIIQTASGTGTRVVMAASGNKLSVYDSSNRERVKIATDGLYLQGATEGFNASVTASVSGADTSIDIGASANITLTCGAGTDEFVKLDAGGSNGLISVFNDAGTGRITMTADGGIVVNANMNPGADNTYDLGSASARWNQIHVSQVNAPGNQNLELEADSNDITCGVSIRPDEDDVHNCGTSGMRWNEVWAANGTIQTSDERKKELIEDEGLGLDFILELKPKAYFRKKEGDHRRRHGLIAQDILATISGADFVYGNEEDGYALNYADFVGPLIKAVQEQAAQIYQLRAEVAALRGKE